MLPAFDLCAQERKVAARPNPLLTVTSLTTLYDVLNFYAAAFLAAANTLDKIWYEIVNSQKKALPRVREDLVSALDTLAEVLHSVEIKSLDGQIKRLGKKAANPESDWLAVVTLLEELRHGVIDVAKSHRFLMLSPDDTEFFLEPPISEGTLEKLPMIEADIIEAGKCYALDRWTASIFHSMRVLEIGLRIMAAKLGVKPLANWYDLIKGCEKAIEEISLDTHGTDWRQEKHFYAEAATDFRHFKDAWRNYAMHVGDPRKGVRQYGKSEAWRVLTHVRSFMEHLSTRVSDSDITADGL